jgi:energy-coupling factor transporter ATP-binding protein EcfA2
MKPKVLVLDEPTANLDPMSANSILNILVKLHRESGVTIVLVEHRLEMSAPYADRCIIFEEGRIVLNGSPEEVLYSEKADSLGIGIPQVVRVAKSLSAKCGFEGRPLSSGALAEMIMGVKG